MVIAEQRDGNVIKTQTILKTVLQFFYLFKVINFSSNYTVGVN